MKDLLLQRYGISKDYYEMGQEVERTLAARFAEIDEIRDYNQLKVLSAMQRAGLSERHFATSTGYGYEDIGRDLLDEIYAEVFGAEDAMVRTQIISGTQALTIALFGLLRPGDELLAATGKPYDTLEEVIGIRPRSGSLQDFGVTYRQVDLLEDGTPDYAGIEASLTPATKVVEIQRSRGYSYRASFSVEEIGRIIRTVKAKRPDVYVLVDNCYGEFVERLEPTQVGADLMVGSLIKNPGGGLALNGGYLAGTKECIALCADRATAPGLGKHVGASLGSCRRMIQGFYMAPHVVAESVKGAVYTAALFEHLGFQTSPSSQAHRADIIQAIRFEKPELLKAYCRAIQAAAPVDSFVVPEAWDMPGYESPVIMAAGSFVQGASIELSADGPMAPPYIAFMQGGLVYANVKLAALLGAQAVCKERG